MSRPNYHVEKLKGDHLFNLCELPTCIPAQYASYEVICGETRLLVCEHHAEGLRCFADYFNTRIVLEPLEGDGKIQR